jgi:NAD dependent epimerase/dehydratase family enzyme
VITQKVFAKSLGSVLHRPAVSWMPSPIVKALFGEMGYELLLNGVAVKSTRLAAMGFEFAYPTLARALRELLI